MKNAIIATIFMLSFTGSVFAATGGIATESHHKAAMSHQSNSDALVHQQAVKIQQADPSLKQIAVISIFGAKDPADLEQKLAQKSYSIGGSAFKVIMTSGNDNSERGSAVVYKG